eukprot:866537-Prymnesium_polylepis.2
MLLPTLASLSLEDTAAPGDEQDPLSLASDEEDNDPVPMASRQALRLEAFARHDLFLADSREMPWTTGGGIGLFAGRAIPKGTLIGLYGGNFMTDEEYAQAEAATPALKQYAMTVRDTVYGFQSVIAPPIAAGSTRPDLARWPMCAMNEGVASRNNVRFAPIFPTIDQVTPALAATLDADQHDGIFAGVAAYTCRDVGASRELLVSYGPDFQRGGYTPRQPCTLPREQFLEPITALGRFPGTVVTFVLGSADSGNEADSDSSWDGQS